MIDKKVKEFIPNIPNFQCHYIEDFITALKKVDSMYYTYTTSKKVTKYPERVFAYELYHQFRIIMARKKDIYKDVHLNGEQTKSREVVEDLERCAPDLILHKSLFECSPEGQLWLCEIKMKNNNDAMKDLRKFSKMEKLNFPVYIFLYAGVTFKEMIKQIEEENQKRKIKCAHKIICISAYNQAGTKQFRCCRLEEIIKNTRMRVGNKRE